MKFIFSLIIVLTLASAAPAAAQRKYIQPVTVSPQALAEAYATDLSQADYLYTGKLLIVTGRIKTIHPPQRPYRYKFDRIYAYVTIDAGPNNRPLVVFFWNWEASNADNLKTGSTLTVMGFCQGVTPQLTLLQSCVYPAGCGGPVPGFEGPYFKLPPSPLPER